MRKIAKYLLVTFVVIVAILFLGFKKNLNLQGMYTYDTSHFNENTDIWLDEGVATYLAGQQSELSDVSVPTFEEMQSQSQGEFVENGGYIWRYKYVEYLVTTYGAQKVVDLIETNDYERCLGKSKLAIYGEWVAYVGSESLDWRKLKSASMQIGGIELCESI